MTVGSDIFVSHVRTPEQAGLLVRAERSTVPGRWVVSMDYGEDVCTARASEAYDPARHGDRIPGYALLRPYDTVEDARREADNGKLAASMLTTFLKAARSAAPDIRIPYCRLSFGRTRFYVRYALPTALDARPDLSVAISEMTALFGVSVQCRQMGPRDEVAQLGGLGPCGRVCCCATWQTSFPQRLAPERREALPSLMNGRCGRFKCCLAFEREGGLPASSSAASD